MAIPKAKLRQIRALLAAATGKQAVSNTVKEQIAQEQRELEAWQAANTENGTTELVNRWRTEAGDAKDEIVDIALRAHTFADGIVKANDMFRYGLKMDGADIDLATAVDLFNKVFKIELATLYVSKTTINSEVARLMMERIVAREFPLKDNSTNDGRVARNNSPALPQVISRTDK